MIDDYKEGNFVYNDNFTITPDMFSYNYVDDDHDDDVSNFKFYTGYAYSNVLKSTQHNFFSVRKQMLAAQTLLLGDSKKGYHHRITLYKDIKSSWGASIRRVSENVLVFIDDL